MKKIYLVRHCLAEGQHKDSPLTTVGMRQAILLSQFFDKQNLTFDGVISSPYLRAIESIKPFAKSNNLHVDVDERLQERILSNEPVDDWMEVLEQSFNELDFKLPGGESANDAINRGNAVYKSVMENKDLNNIILVSHGNLISLILKSFDPTIGFDEWKNLNNPDVYLLESNGVQHSITRLWEGYY
ncbi:histidine phosphatase family protein [Virgibacillus phasianinus]|uniref:Histidine phosphatase family protein n=1 Tax=Virgibacillus phasianinus TaxID=2017483 RepID=A0A220U5K2_9BACI|nr:histidine phosphatase family protein [Virgibacillus phasianinus]ASK63397.1 histidine phosphatase family protein [Virgibacillus phasianinus]